MRAMNIVVAVTDLMDRSRISGAAAGVTFVSVDALGTAEADLVVADLRLPGALEGLAACPSPTIGYCPHVDDDLRERAAEAGIGRVLPRSVFFGRLRDVLTPPNLPPR